MFNSRTLTLAVLDARGIMALVRGPSSGNRAVYGDVVSSGILQQLFSTLINARLDPEITGHCLFGLGQGCVTVISPSAFGMAMTGQAKIVPALSDNSYKTPLGPSPVLIPLPSSLPPFPPSSPISLSSLSFFPSTSLFLTPVSIVHLKRVLSKRSTTLTPRLTDQQ